MARRKKQQTEDAHNPGDIVIVPYPRIREQIGLGTEAGLFMEDRRNTYRVWFPDSDRSFYLEPDHLQVVPLGRVPLDPIAEHLHRVARLVDAVLIEVHAQDEEKGQYHVFTPSLTIPQIDEIQTILGADLESITIKAGSVRRVKLELIVRNPTR